MKSAGFWNCSLLLFFLSTTSRRLVQAWPLSPVTRSRPSAFPRPRTQLLPFTMPRRPLRATSSDVDVDPTPLKALSNDETKTKDNNSHQNMTTAEAERVWSDWINHSDSSYHHFEQGTATEIRRALLDWYRVHRRKLPWRGDPPPYDGSTAGINTTPSALNTKQKAAKSTSKITSFFAPNSMTKRSKTTNTSKASNQPTKIKMDQDSTVETTMEAIPVSGYGVWVSEIMLQQTRVEAVIPYWCKWMKSFPTVHHLAAATEDEVNAHWAGLGFYRRARLLHQGAQYVVKEHDGQLPQTVEGLLQITGIGPYTASAIASIAFDVCVPVVDGNVCRVLSRLTGVANHIKAPSLKDKEGWVLARQLVEAGNTTTTTTTGHPHAAGEVNQALMELGATYCAPSGTGIDPRDPLRDYYQSTRLGRAYVQLRQQAGIDPRSLLHTNSEPFACSLCDENGIFTVLDALEEGYDDKMSLEDGQTLGHTIFPLDPPKTKKREEDLSVLALSNSFRHNETWWLLIKRPKSGLLAGQWEFPSVCVQTRDKGSKSPLASLRKKSLTSVLREMEDPNAKPDEPLASLARTAIEPAPLEHIFSHVKHIMWVEAAEVSKELTTWKWMTSSGREVRWMREKDMKEVGITAGVKKILKAVKTQQQKGQTLGRSGTTSQRKRKR